jgi:hypothetical protein
MFSTIQEGFDAYKKALKEFLRKQKRFDSGEFVRGMCQMQMELDSMEAPLEGMAEALGLTKKENSKLKKEIEQELN